MLEEENFSLIVCRELGLWTRAPDLDGWTDLVRRIHHLKKTTRIALVGKYVQLHDAYLSVAEALRHAGYACDAAVEIEWINSENVTAETAPGLFAGCDGIIVPGGFGNRGLEGMIDTVRYAREQKIPYFGICLGMQMAVVEFARDVCGLQRASSGELDPDSPHRVIDFLPDQSDDVDKGGTLRLGAYPCRLQEGSLLRQCYGAELVQERHRHRYEFNNDYRQILSEHGLLLSGKSPDGYIVEAVELPEHPFFVGVQFHPEFKSRPDKPHPIFRGFIRAALAQRSNTE